MPKPALMRPKTFELVMGLSVVILVAGLVLSRSGPQRSSAAQPGANEPAAATISVPSSPRLSYRIEQQQRERDERAEAAARSALAERPGRAGE